MKHTFKIYDSLLGDILLYRLMICIFLLFGMYTDLRQYVHAANENRVPDLAPVTEEMQELSDVILDSLTEVEKYLFFI